MPIRGRKMTIVTRVIKKITGSIDFSEVMLPFRFVFHAAVLGLLATGAGKAISAPVGDAVPEIGYTTTAGNRPYHSPVKLHCHAAGLAVLSPLRILIASI